GAAALLVSGAAAAPLAAAPAAAGAVDPGAGLAVAAAGGGAGLHIGVKRIEAGTLSPRERVALKATPSPDSTSPLERGAGAEPIPLPEASIALTDSETPKAVVAPVLRRFPRTMRPLPDFSCE